MREKKDSLIYTIWLRMGRMECVLLYKFITEITESLKPLLELVAPQEESLPPAGDDQVFVY